MALRRTLSTTAIAALLTGAALAQETGGLQLTFGLEERLESGRNIALATPAEGTTTAASTRLSFGLTSETATQALSISSSAALRFAREQDGTHASDLDTPSFALIYARTGANAAFTVDLNYQRERLAQVDLTAETDNPGDLNDLQGGGDRATYSLGTTLDIATSAPFGFGLRARESRVDYFDTTDPDLADSRTTTLGATARLRFSPVTEGRIEVDRIRFRPEGAGNPDRDTTILAFGVTQEMTDGTLDVRLATTDDTVRDRLTLDFGRTLDLPSGALTARIGVTKADQNDAALIGLLDWRQDLPDGSLSLRLTQAETTTDAGANNTASLASLGYTKDINAVSGIGLDLSMALISETGANDVQRIDLSALYRHELTEDWDMNFGATYQTRHEDTVGRANSPAVFFSLSRVFEVRP
jgi:hypothetical protein